MTTRINRALCVLIVAALFCLAGCGAQIVRPIQPAAQSKPVSTPTVALPAYPVVISASDLASFEDAFNTESNYGFLLSAYNDVRDVDLYQVFYVGAGIAPPTNTDEIRTAYEATLTDGPYDVDSTILSYQQIDDFLYVKTGYTLAEMHTDLGWAYVDGYDAFIHYHGDTNFMSMHCTGGRQVGDTVYELDYEFEGGIYDEDGNFYSGGTVNVSVDGNTILYNSNILY